MKTKVLLFCALITGFAVLLAGCRSAAVVGGPVDGSGLSDGVFRGECKAGPNKAVVDVTIRNRVIERVDLIEHDAWKGHKADSLIVKRIIESQSTKVDAVSGATNSSAVIMNAVEAAVVKSRDAASAGAAAGVGR
jgi:uncharacterized protein with FMN-binding domain